MYTHVHNYIHCACTPSARWRWAPASSSSSPWRLTPDGTEKGFHYTVRDFLLEEGSLSPHGGFYLACSAKVQTKKLEIRSLSQKCIEVEGGFS